MWRVRALVKGPRGTEGGKWGVVSVSEYFSAMQEKKCGGAAPIHAKPNMKIKNIYEVRYNHLAHTYITQHHSQSPSPH